MVVRGRRKTIGRRGFWTQDHWLYLQDAAKFDLDPFASRVFQLTHEERIVYNTTGFPWRSPPSGWYDDRAGGNAARNALGSNRARLATDKRKVPHFQPDPEGGSA